MAAIAIDREALAEFCRRNQIRKLALFGSVLGVDFRAESDVDVLVEFAPGKAAGFIALGGMASELSELFGGHEVDLVTPKALNPHIRERVLAEAEVHYAEG